MCNPAEFTVPVPLRCCWQDGNPGSLACGELANWLRSSSSGVTEGFFCYRHKLPDDEPIPASYVMNRVQITAEITLSGTSMAPSLAKREALERVTQAVESIGGAFSLHGITSRVARYAPPPRPGRRRTDAVGAQ